MNTREKINAIMSDCTHFDKYASFQSQIKRRETYIETCVRNMDMHIEEYPFLADKIERLYKDFVFTKKLLPSMRSLQFGGQAIKKNNARLYNCSYAPVEHVKIFSEAMFLLLSGVGFGYSVKQRHIKNLPDLIKPNNSYTYQVQDSIEGWADAIDALVQCYLVTGNLPIFDLSLIREKGARIVTSGGKAPGPEPLKQCLNHIKDIFENLLNQGMTRLDSIDCHSILCRIANAVLSGGIRRAAMICLFDYTDNKMLKCKQGEFWNKNPHFAMANNSASILRDSISHDEFVKLWKDVELSGTGEPGIIWTSNEDWGFNPCVEASLRPYTFCNLVEINGDLIFSQKDLNEVSEAAAFLNTLQASYTDFHYLRDIWKENTQEDALIGVSITGIGSGNLDDLDLITASQIVKKVNKEVSSLIGINTSARCCLVKPAGTTSVILSTSSGIHDYFDSFYIRRVRVNKLSPICDYLKSKLPNTAWENDIFDKNAIVVSYPQKSPDKAHLRNKTTVSDLLERVKRFNLEWIRPSHNRGENYHNVSATISVKPNEWGLVGDWIWNNKDFYSGLSVLPYDGGLYQQSPFESITEERYNELSKAFENVEFDLTEIIELDDNTELKESIACSGGVCDI